MEKFESKSSRSEVYGPKKESAEVWNQKSEERSTLYGQVFEGRSYDRISLPGRNNEGRNT